MNNHMMFRRYFIIPKKYFIKRLKHISYIYIFICMGQGHIITWVVWATAYVNNKITYFFMV